jgi:hypothetical protein
MVASRYKDTVGSTLSNGTYIAKYYTIRESARWRSYFDYICFCGSLFTRRCDYVDSADCSDKYVPNCGCSGHRSDYNVLCKECGGPRDPKWGRALCNPCLKEENKLSAREKKGGVIYSQNHGWAPKGTLDPAATYHANKLCNTCDVPFAPKMSKHVRCSPCRLLTRDIKTRVTEPHRSHKRSQSSAASIVDITRRYIRATNCVYCNRMFSDVLRKSFDHIIPVCLGGSSEADNIAICCRPCNQSKGGRTLEDWLNQCACVYAHTNTILENFSHLIVVPPANQTSQPTYDSDEELSGRLHDMVG